MQTITPFLWFDGQAEEAMNFYVSIFRNSRILSVNRIGDARPGATSPVTTVSFELDGQEFAGLNGGPKFKFTEAVSMVVNCDTQEEVDYYWAKLTEGGKEVQCGWLKDKFGLSWQVIPRSVIKMMQGGSAEQSQRVMGAVMKMVKIDIAAVKQAYDG